MSSRLRGYWCSLCKRWHWETECPFKRYIESGKSFEKLATRDLESLPYRVLKDSGRLDEFERVFNQRSDIDKGEVTL